ncbi:MAG: type II toxin-antitoxin system RelE/ParE family toxin [Bacillota bacterium]|nr:type II toxin-antitoxin system RelE/ParE family toxin [Bacillota bacterium]
MNYNVILTESAERDLDEILTYVVCTLCNTQAARDLYCEFLKRFEDIGRYPYMFEWSRNEHLKEKGYRRFAVKNYIALYKVYDEGKRVMIARIFSAKRKYDHLI